MKNAFMKMGFRKILLSVPVFFAVVFTASAQDYPSGLGIRIGNSLGIDYKIFVNSSQALDFGIGVLEPFNGLKDRSEPQFALFYSQYLFHFNVFAPGVNVFVGPGVSVGAQLGYEEEDKYLEQMLGTKANFYLSIDAAVGIEYKMADLPLALSFAWSPKVQVVGSKRLVSRDENGNSLRPEQFYSQDRPAARLGDLTIGIRYTF